MRVRLERAAAARRSANRRIENGDGEFSGVNDINELLGNYASAEAQARPR